MHLFQKSNFSRLFDAAGVFLLDGGCARWFGRPRGGGEKTPLDKVKLKGKA